MPLEAEAISSQKKIQLAECTTRVLNTKAPAKNNFEFGLGALLEQVIIKASDLTRGLEIDTFAALARTRGDIHYPSCEKLDHCPLSLFTYKQKFQRCGNIVGISHLHF